ncbi:hypothetical protein BDP27DRAFT_1428594 [Rhodocollybia butyracea]|uniref:Uncharacterized protein n=1 Tax=Rhodocollybia butyracea TaxID=206335 RepID=A0A9P5PDA8_9AGAR|nr:hypothetical protein BDP27DRAFT_1428594 [Rhodocollybia butyracea]
MSKAEEEEGNFEEPNDLIDLTQLCAQFFPDLDVLKSKVISQELSDFCFAQDPLATNETTFFQDSTMADDNGDDGIDAFAAMADAPAGDDTGGDNYGGGMGMMDQDDFGDSNIRKIPPRLKHTYVSCSPISGLKAHKLSGRSSHKSPGL